ncbi:MAG: dissimilatory-type sulfite reductase subunit beta [Anaerolineae bacterium]
MPGIGIPKKEKTLPPILKRNYGQWRWHEVPRPGVIKHVAEGGETCYTVRAGMPPNARVSTELARRICDLADAYSQGHLRLTRRHSLELVGVAPDKIDEIIEKLNGLGLPVGGTDRALHNIVSCTGWLHCQFAATDAPAISKALSEALWDEFQTEALPAKLKISISGCVNNCGEAVTADIGVVGVHRDLPRVDDEKVARCEMGLIISICPTGAIKPKPPKSVRVDPERCIHCVACVGQCEGMPIGDPDTDGVAIYIGGKAGNAGSGPNLGKLVVPWLPNTTPDWPETVQAVRTIVDTWKAGARRHERIIDWVNRIGWEKFFQKTGLPMSDKLLDGFAMWPAHARTGVRFRW